MMVYAWKKHAQQIEVDNMTSDNNNVLLTLAYTLSGYIIGWPTPLLSLASRFRDLQ